MRGAEVFLRALEKTGVKYLFGLPGSTEAAILDALAGDSKLNYILALHENVAVGMADGYARASGQVGVANLHTSVGTFNGLANLYNAWRDASPVLLTVGNKDSRLFSRNGFCVVEDLPEIPRQITKWSWQTVHPQEIAGDVYRAVKTSMAAPWGPVYLSIPEDLLAAEVFGEVPEADGLNRVHSVTRPGREGLAKAVEVLRSARQPLLVAGNEVAGSGALEELARLAQVLAAPVVLEQRQSATSLNFLSSHPNLVGRYNPQAPAVQEADVIFFVGGQVLLDFNYPGVPQVPPGARLIHLHPSAWELGRVYPVEVPLVGDIREGLLDLLEALGQGQLPGQGERAAFLASLQQGQAEAAPAYAPPAEVKPIKGDWLIKEMQRVFPPQTIIVDEAIRTSPPLLAGYRFNIPGTYFHTGGGALGWGIPAALGISLARSGQKVAALVGDGSSLFTIQALWTAARYNIPVLSIICNNRTYMAVKSAVKEYNGLAVQKQNFVGSSLDNPAIDFVNVAAGFGVPGRRVERAGQVAEALEEGLNYPGPYLLEVVLSKS